MRNRFACPDCKHASASTQEHAAHWNATHGMPQPYDPDEFEEWVHCEHCEDGYVGHDCGEDCCPCLYPEPNVICDICDGEGGWKPKPLDVAQHVNQPTKGEEK